MLFLLLRTLLSALRSHRALALENLALRNQLNVLKRDVRSQTLILGLLCPDLQFLPNRHIFPHPIRIHPILLRRFYGAISPLGPSILAGMEFL